MKLLYLSGAPNVSTHDSAKAGGPRSHILGVIDGFKSNGWEVQEYIFGNSFQKNIENRDVHQSLSSNILIRIVADLFRIALGIYNSRKALRLHPSVDLMYERLAAFQMIGYLYKKRKGVTWVLETNSVISFEAKKDRKGLFFSSWCRYFENKAYHNCDYLICVTDELKDMILQHFNVDPKKILVIPNGVNTGRFDPAKYQHVQKNTDFTVGFVGILLAWCGVDTLINAVHLLKEKGFRVNAVIVGDGLMMDEWQMLAHDLGVAKEVAFLGHKNWNEIPGFIKTLDVCYSGQVPTKSGKMYHSPLKIYEYLSMGKPVIGSDFQDAKNTIKDGINGFRFLPGDSVDLASKIQWVHDAISSHAINFDDIRNEVVLKHSWEARVKLILSNIDGFSTYYTESQL
jgi:glycosyltransferase involved in cell wall biosynthesis